MDNIVYIYIYIYTVYPNIYGNLYVTYISHHNGYPTRSKLAASPLLVDLPKIFNPAVGKYRTSYLKVLYIIHHASCK